MVQTNDAKKSVKPGAKINFKIRISNTGNQTVNNVVVTNILVNGKKQSMNWKVGTLKASEEVMLSFTFTLSRQAKAGKYTSTSVATGKLSNGKALSSKNSVTSFMVLKVVAASTAKASVSAAKKSTFSKAVIRGTKTRTASGGFFFRDDKGRPITAFKYATLNNLYLVDVLADSRDPVDQNLVRAYYSGLSLVGKNDKTGKAITLADVIHDLRTAPQFRTIYTT